MDTADAGSVLRFDAFELDLRTRELRKNGRLLKFQDLPARLLALLATRPGELVTREEIEKALWGEDQFVDFEHGINTAMRKIREALGEDPENARFIETLPRKGYRFIAAVEAGALNGGAMAGTGTSHSGPAAAVERLPDAGAHPGETASREAAAAQIGGAAANQQAETAATEDFRLPGERARTLFLLIQAGYLAMYTAALYKTDAIGEVMTDVLRAPAGALLPAVLVLATCGIAVRLYLLTSVGLKHPAAGRKYRNLFPAVFVMDALWAASPLLLVRRIGLGLALAAVAGLAYLPFAQRTLNLSIYPGGQPSARRR